MLKYLLLIVVWTAMISARNLGVPCDFYTESCERCPGLLSRYQENIFGCPMSCDCVHDPEMLFEGDIKLEGPSLALANKLYGISSDDNEDASYALTSNSRLFWPKSSDTRTVKVPIVLDSGLNSAAKQAIRDAIRDFKSKTCIRFVARKNEIDHVRFFAGRGCYSSLGRRGRKQDISVGQGCETKGTVIHEIMHALGFWHEQSRPDRDDYVTINYENIKSGKEHNFRKKAASEINSLGSPYDCGSIMHYGATYFTKNGKATITPKSGCSNIGQRTGFSVEDLKQIRARYCSNTDLSAGNCEDKKPSCPRWKNAGFCTKKYKTYMQEYCKKSCGLC